MSRKRIAFVHYPHGVDRARLETMPFACNAVAALAATGWNVDLYLWERYSAVYENIFSQNVNIVWSKHMQENVIQKIQQPGYMNKIRKLKAEKYFKSLKHYKCIFGVGQVGIYIASLISASSNAPLIYFNDEFPSTWGDSSLAIWERKAAVLSDIIVVPDECRYAPLCEELGILDNKPYAVIPNLTQTTIPENSIDWHTYYNLPKNTSLFLNAGSLADWAQIPELLCTLPYWPDNTALILHSRTPDIQRYKKQLSHLDLPGRLVWSKKSLSEKELNSLVSVSSGNFGLYRDSGPNIRYIGKSSGKLMRSIFCGVPVIASRYESLNFIEENGLGVLVSNPSEIATAVNKIVNNQTGYRERCMSYTKSMKTFDVKWNDFCETFFKITNLRLTEPETTKK
jgi:glycosyltransferase involved in cell wall biosynthesis